MPIYNNKNDEIEKYIFNPDKPKQCKSYKLLLKIAKKENFSFFSSEILQYLFADKIIGQKFKDELWDLPDDYDNLSFDEKIELFVEQLSQADLDDYIKNINIEEINIDQFLKNRFLHKLCEQNFESSRCIFKALLLDDFKTLILKWIFKDDNNYSKNHSWDDNNTKNHFILFSKNNFGILKSKVQKSSIIITLEENIDEYKKYENRNIKPIFLKKIEDLDLLLTVLDEDLKQIENKNINDQDIKNISNVSIKDLFSIKDISINDMKDKKEIYIVGENGDGKSLFLQALAIGIVGTKDGAVVDMLKTNDNKHEIIINESNFHTHLLAYGSSRNNNCYQKDDEDGYLTLFDTNYDLTNPIKWLQHLDYSQKDLKDEEVLISVEKAKELLNNILNKDIQIDISSKEVTFKEKGSIIDFNRLSAGYKGVITLVCDMISKLSKKQTNIKEIKDYEGVVLIDEVELHLHPKWKYDFMTKLREVFPKIQFIVTTHSPTVILGASKEAVFYKIYKEDGVINISNQMPNEGYTHNSLVSSPIFDLPTMKSKHLDNNLLNDDDYVYSRIHTAISKKIKNTTLSVDEIDDLINKELDAL